MKIVVFLLFIMANIFACTIDEGGVSPKPKGDVVVMSPTPDTDICVEKSYSHKSEAELAAMTPAQRINEKLKHEFYHMPAGASDSYSTVLSKYVRNDGIRVMPVLTDIANQHNPATTSRCERLRFFVAFSSSNDIDEAQIRLRGTKEGLTTIKALENALRRMKGAGFDEQRERQTDYDSYLQDLKRLQGTSVDDSIIQDTLRLEHNIQMSDEQLLEFSNFLTSIDPSYPAWSDAKYGPPLLLKNSRKYYDAYLKFSKNK